MLFDYEHTASYFFTAQAQHLNSEMDRLKLKDFKKSRTIRSATIPTISAITGAVIAAILKDYSKLILAEGILAHAIEVILLFLLVTNLLIFILLKTIYSDVSDAYGIRVRYVDIEKDGETTMYNELGKIIAGAEKSIWIVNSYLPEVHPEEDDTSDHSQKQSRRRAADSRRVYYDKIKKKAVDNQIQYWRIQQCEEEKLDSVLAFDHERLKHFHDMIDERDTAGTDIKLWKVPATRPITFILVDETKLMWQVSEVDFSGGKERIRPYGAFIFQDEQLKITAHFIAYVKHLTGSHSQAIERNMLLPRGRDIKRALGYDHA